VADADTLRRRMVEGLVERGELDEQWRAAFAEVLRHWSVPDFIDTDSGCQIG
jgi:hypothetical protein